MRIAARTPLGLWTALIAVACVSAAGTYALAGNRKPQSRHNAAARGEPAPSAREFARFLVGVTTDYAQKSGDATRIVRPDCVQASAGHYMCSYAVMRPNRTVECHVVQARWTPQRLSTITVTLSGRAKRCGTLREAIRSLD